MDIVNEKYKEMFQTVGDIHEHIPTLYKYARECESVLELGVKHCVSSWAFVKGLLDNGKINKRFFMNDIDVCDIKMLLEACSSLPISIDYKWENDLNLELKDSYDIVFIDTWHVYGQLKRELIKFAKICNKYIIMHDTTVDEWMGETIRNRMDGLQQSKDTGIPIKEIYRGLWPAVEDFLKENKEWKIKERFINCNGLTILEKTDDKTCIYSCFFGNDNNWANVIKEAPTLEYPCYFFTNNMNTYNKLEKTKWRRIFVHKEIANNNIISCMQSKEFKSCPHRFVELLNYDITIYCDSKVIINNINKIKSIISVLEKSNYSMIMAKHPLPFTNVWDEYKLCLGTEKYNIQKELYKNYLNKYLKIEGITDTINEHFAGGFIIRKNNDICKEIGETWLSHIEECGIEDQISFSIVQQLYKGKIFGINWMECYDVL